MTGFNALLLECNRDLDLSTVRLVRHQDTRFKTALSPYDAWILDDGRLESYQSVQKRPVFADVALIAAFVATPVGETVFIGMYENHGCSTVPQGTPDRLTGEDVSGQHQYDLRRSPMLQDLHGRVVIDWGPAARTWVQRPDNQNKLILEISRARYEPPFPGFMDFTAQLSGLRALPAAWKGALAAVNGVYLLVCPNTGERYVGSASGESGFWGRWEAYVSTGHGGNIGMREVPPSDYHVSILEVAASSASIADILAMEARWKRKLFTRDFGLNRN
ncbi:GIY-YIG nuclease family protein [Roseomonas genomospecies 6]|uniref:GIY-YIG nuclease family protein n=1 Tax=Roseomonas genomospecies 6 TaxID=214106 RepID=A0A9W7NI54_9PROT|nr:GIY-YIG nuclease family protein [Roseomonas genomospecies 6]KAA0679422.1 GIY-YIG nuclease family protein [Roseomonas genomospecies 6]